MKISIVMPMAVESAIADVTLQAIDHLRAIWDLDIWCPEAPRLRRAPVPVSTFTEVDDRVLRALAGRDLVVYVLGDSPLHTPIVPLMAILPGVCVLHDASLTNLLRHVALATDSMDLMCDRIAELHGDRAAHTFRTAGDGLPIDRWLDVCADLPLSELAVEGSLAALVHSGWHAHRLAGALAGDVVVGPLPPPGRSDGAEHTEDTAATDRAVDAALAAIDPLDMLVVTVGHANANRRIDQIIDALGSDAHLGRRVQFWVVGSAEPSVQDEIDRHAQRVGLGGRVRVTGRVSNATLASVLERADIGLALRSPVLEGQSASLLSQMKAGLPVVVLDHAHYAELPDDLVVSVPPDGTASHLAGALRRLVDEPGERARMGARARSWVETSRTGELYADAFVAAVDAGLRATPLASSTQDVAARLGRLGLNEVDAVRTRAAEVLLELYG